MSVGKGRPDNYCSMFSNLAFSQSLKGVCLEPKLCTASRGSGRGSCAELSQGLVRLKVTPSYLLGPKY